MDKKEKISSMVINNTIVDLNTVSYDKLDQLKDELEIEQEKIRKEIDEILMKI